MGSDLFQQGNGEVLIQEMWHECLYWSKWESVTPLKRYHWVCLAKTKWKMLRELFHWRKWLIRKGRFWTNQHRGSCSSCWSTLDSKTLVTSLDFLLQFIFFLWTVLRTLLLTLLNLWTKYWIFNKAICGCEIYILTVNFSKIFLHIADLNFLPMKKLAQSILRCKFPLYIRPSKRAFEKYKPQGFNIFHFTVIKSWPQLFKSWMGLSTNHYPVDKY